MSLGRRHRILSQYGIYEATAQTHTIAKTPAVPFELIGCTVSGADSQAGTPTPDAPVDIQCVKAGTQIGVCGKNLFDIFQSSIILINEPYNGCNGWSTKITKIPKWMFSKKVTYSATITFNATTSYAMVRIWVRAAGENLALLDGNRIQFGTTEVSSVTLDLSSYPTAEEVWFGLCIGAASATVSKGMVELGTAATAYEPYQSGGTIAIERDLHQWDSFDSRNGLYTVGSGIDIITSSGSLSLNSNYSSETVNCFIANMEPIGEDFDPRAVKPCWCNIAGFQKTGWDSKLPNTFCVQSAHTNGRRIVWFFVSASECPDLSAFASMLDRMKSQGTPVMVVYQLSTPTTVQGTVSAVHTVPGTTNIYSVQTDNTNLCPDLAVRAATFRG